MFGKFFRKKFRKRLDNDYENMESYAVSINAAKTLVGNDAELLNELDRLQQDLHYNVIPCSASIILYSPNPRL